MTYAIKFQALIALFVILSSCSSKQGEIKKVLHKMEKVPVTMNKDKYRLWTPDSAQNKVRSDKNVFTFVVYADSSQCSSCFVNRLCEWNELLAEKMVKNGTVGFIFIMEPREGETEILVDHLNNSSFLHPVLIDYQHQFRKDNPQIPKGTAYHDFLMNQKGNIVLVGDPLHNKSIRELFDKEINNHKDIKE